MTRDEAIDIWDGNKHVIDRFTALGMLKLDEPEPLDIRINRAINTELLSGRDKHAMNIKLALDGAGLKIVEK